MYSFSLVWVLFFSNLKKAVTAVDMQLIAY